MQQADANNWSCRRKNKIEVGTIPSAQIDTKQYPLLYNQASDLRLRQQELVELGRSDRNNISATPDGKDHVP